ncbi:hypothetical protein TNCV_3430111 [Trichonephila clavipes]|nr:hypothetical protein TNCV_3430111 [Trichonephila clavipes]
MPVLILYLAQSDDEDGSSAGTPLSLLPHQCQMTDLSDLMKSTQSIYLPTYGVVQIGTTCGSTVSDCRRGVENEDTYRAIVTVYGEHCLGQTSCNSWLKSFREGHQMISDLHDNVRSHVSHETNATLKKFVGKC